MSKDNQLDVALLYRNHHLIRLSTESGRARVSVIGPGGEVLNAKFSPTIEGVIAAARFIDQRSETSAD